MAPPGSTLPRTPPPGPDTEGKGRSFGRGGAIWRGGGLSGGEGGYREGRGAIWRGDMIPCGERCGERGSCFCKAESRDRSTKRPRAATVRPARRAAHAPEERGGGEGGATPTAAPSGEWWRRGRSGPPVRVLGHVEGRVTHRSRQGSFEDRDSAREKSARLLLRDGQQTRGCGAA